MHRHAGNIKWTGMAAIRLASSFVAAFLCQAAMALDVTVPAGTTYVVSSNAEFSTGSTITLYGTLDLNGFNVSIRDLQNAPATDGFRTNFTAHVISSAGPATLTLGNVSAYTGTFADNVSVVLKHGQSSFFGRPGDFAGPSFTLNGGYFVPYTQPTELRFVFHRPVDPEAFLQVSEIELTYQGKPLPRSAYKSVAATSTRAKHSPDELIDRNLVNQWSTPDGIHSATVTIYLDGAYKIDGYRLGTPYYPRCAPYSWDVYFYRWTECGCVLLDRHVEEWIRPVTDKPDVADMYSSQLTPNYAFAWPERLGSVLSDATALVFAEKADSFRMRVSTVEPLRCGAVSGATPIRLDGGSSFAPGDLTDYSGPIRLDACNDRFHMAEVRLDADRGPAEQPVRIDDPAHANVTVCNGGSKAVSLLLDGRTDYLPCGRLADGERGTLGLVKRGDNTVDLAIRDADYTGETRVEAGTLRVARARTTPYSAKYVKFEPSAIRGPESFDYYGYYWGINEFELLDADGNKVVWPAGTTVDGEFHPTANAACLIDGNPLSRSLVSGGSWSQLPAITFCLPNEVSFASYRWAVELTTGAKDKYDTDIKRTPTAWRVSISSDKVNWACVSEASYSGSEYPTADVAIWRGPYAAHGCEPALRADQLYTLPQTLWGAYDATRDTHVPAVKARYLRFTPSETVDWVIPGDPYAYGWQVSEFNLYRKGERLLWDGAVASGTNGCTTSASGSSFANLVDNVRSGAGGVNRFFGATLTGSVVIDAGKAVEFDAYGFTSGADYLSRLPSSWTLEASADGVTWEVIDQMHRAEGLATAGYTDCGPWSLVDRFPLLAAGASNAIGDGSVVRVAPGATFELEAAYERVGGLAGEGTVVVPEGSTLALSPTGAPSFAGSVACAGTLEFAEGSQLFDGASCGGRDLAVSFAGGAVGGCLGGIGALRVTGTPCVAIPEDLADGARVELFAYASLDAASRTALEAAQPASALPRGYQLRMVVDETKAVAVFEKRGFTVIFR